MDDETDDTTLSDSTSQVEAPIPIEDGRASAWLDHQELQGLRRVLDYNRDRLVDEIERLERTRPPQAPGAGPTTGSMISEANWAAAVTQRTIAEKRSILREIDEALHRMSASTYGQCVVDGHLISRAVLQEVPWLKYCEHCRSTGRTTPARPGIATDRKSVV